MRLITELTGRYHLEELIAAGGMGEVWRAVDQVLARPVAVKLLRPEYTHDEVTLARFRAEAQHAGLLNHPGIAQVYDYRDASPESPAYLVMELVAGPSLAAVLAAGRLEPAPAQLAPVSSGRHPTGTPARSAAVVRMVNVSASLAGRPVAVVRRELRALGLLVEVRTQPDGQAAPGTVLRLHPTGQVRAGSVILITAATQPPSARRVSPAPAPGRPTGARPVPPGHAKQGKHGNGPPPGPG